MIHLPHLETNITVACQNRCIACNHFVPMQVDRFKTSMMPVSVLEQDLRRFARLAHADGYALIGGEPTLHPSLVDLMHVARRSGIADRYEVWTNGQTLLELPDAFWLAAHVIVVSVYPGKLTDAYLADVQEKARTFGATLEIKDERRHPNFTQLLTSNSNAVATQRRYDRCWFKGFSRVLDWGVFYRCCTSPFIPQLLQDRPVGSDGLTITDVTTERDVTEFLGRQTFMESCRVCAGRDTDEAHPITWGEQKNAVQWREQSGGGGQ
jgi:hypothetical protein